MKNKLKRALIISMLLFLLDNNKSNAMDENDKQKYLEEQIDYFKNHKEELDKYVKSKEEILLEERNNTYIEEVSKCIEDIPQEIGDICYYKANTRFGYSPNVIRREQIVDDNELIGWKQGIIINIKEGTNMPIAICEYDEETNTIGNFLGWAKDEDVDTQTIGYSEVIENDLVATVEHGNFADWENEYLDSEGNFHQEDPIYCLPFWCEPIDENHEYGLYIHYSDKEIEGYYNVGEKYISKDIYMIRSKIDPKDIPLKLLKKYGPKNTNK